MNIAPTPVRYCFACLRIIPVLNRKDRALIAKDEELAVLGCHEHVHEHYICRLCRPFLAYILKTPENKRPTVAALKLQLLPLEKKVIMDLDDYKQLQKAALKGRTAERRLKGKRAYDEVEKREANNRAQKKIRARRGAASSAISTPSDTAKETYGKHLLRHHCFYPQMPKMD